MKRLTDIAVSGTGLLVTSPILLLAMLLVWLEDRHSPIFRQQRVGKDGEPFEILKLRSMPVSTPDVESADAAEVKLTRMGPIIRRTNVDELPQLLCILRGDMSIVGPRPALPSQTGLLDMREANGAAALKPGLTGLAQLRSYDGMSPEEKAAHDGEYAAQNNPLYDLGLIFKTGRYLLSPPPQY
ncbi:MAG: sugar transferase [Actinomycetota bacterium]